MKKSIDELAREIVDLVTRSAYPPVVSVRSWLRAQLPEGHVLTRDGDDVMELSTFGAKKYRLHEVCGTLIDRWFDTGSHIHPTKQTYASYHYRVQPFCGSLEPVNWSNCEFCVLLDYNKWSQFAITHADKHRMTLYPERRWDALDERTWWWLAMAKEQEERTLYRTRDWFAENHMDWVEDVGWVERAAT